ncbi:hypothetical protein R3P38DRAFT_3404535 [Favolaschia claudopus]|uniref:Phosphatidate phosphatase APP1 catalytic domain-containing protein n=1 Tax=Favolaschia claudopus TaxID=2862362 RepID=A0AAW0AAJ5_9AGAR
MTKGPPSSAAGPSRPPPIQQAPRNGQMPAQAVPSPFAQPLPNNQYYLSAADPQRPQYVGQTQWSTGWNSAFAPPQNSQTPPVAVPPPPPRPPTPPRVPTPPPPKYKHWDGVVKDFLQKISFKQALTGFESDILVMNPDFEKATVPDALKDLLQGIILIQQEDVDNPLPGQNRTLEERKLDYVHTKNPASQTSITKSISAFLAQNRVNNDASNRTEFLKSLEEKKRKRDDDDASRDNPDGDDAPNDVSSSCARTDAKVLDRDAQMKYDIAKNSDGPLRRTTRQKAKGPAAPDAQIAAPTTTATRTKTKAAANKDKKASSPDEVKSEAASDANFGLDKRLGSIETHFAVNYVPAPPDTLLARLQFLEEHIIRLEKDYPPWAALHFNQPNRGWPPPPRATPIIVPPNLRSTVTSTTALPPGVKAKNTGSSLQRAVMDQVAIKEARSDLAGGQRQNSGSKFSAVKGYLAQRNIPTSLQRGVAADGTKQTWKEWAGQKISAVNTMRGPGNSLNSERIALFPGWAARRYRQDGLGRTEEAFDIDLFVSGFATSHRPAELATRSQKAFLRLAKGFAALPRLEGISDEPSMSKSTEDLLASVKLPPRPTEITEDFEVEALERQFRKLNSDREPSVDSDSEIDLAPSPIVAPSTMPINDIRRLHRNLESRIQPFWSSVLPSRVIRINLFASPLKSDDTRPRHNTMEEQDALEHGPIASRDVTTTVDGSFQARIRISWEELCSHPGALHVAFGDAAIEHELLVTARLSAAAQLPANAAETKTLHVVLTNSPVRVISDIDDTVKLSNVLHGARAVFHNVFVKEFKEIIIPGMGEWYTDMWERGVRFHYVSNGPFEMLPILADFFAVSQLPPGSIKLRSYAGRSLFSGLLSAPAARKRAGVQEILHAFPESRFILIGDSGEQDLELYAELARERPDQVLAVFIRDVDEFGQLLEDPTGWKAVLGAASSSNHLSAEKWPRKSWSTAPSTPTTPAYNVPSQKGDYFAQPPQPWTAEPEPIVEMTPNATPRPASLYAYPQFRRAMTPTPSTHSSSSSSTTGSFTKGGMNEAERKRYDLQLRVWRARTQMPGHVPLRIFRKPVECVEAEEILRSQKL